MTPIQVAKIIRNEMKGRGYNKNAIKSAIANAYGESGLNPLAVQPGTVGRCLWQWSLGTNVSGETVNKWFTVSEKSSIILQTRYLMDYPGQWIFNGKSTYPMTFDCWAHNLKHLSARKLTVAFMEQWERPAVNTYYHGNKRWEDYVKIEHKSAILTKG